MAGLFWGPKQEWRDFLVYPNGKGGTFGGPENGNGETFDDPTGNGGTFLRPNWDWRNLTKRERRDFLGTQPGKAGFLGPENGNRGNFMGPERK